MVSRPERHRVVLGVVVTTQLIALVALMLALAVVVGLAVLSWLESST